ncbi:MAG TPA: glycosyltransferase family 2 protein [Pirellulales bacterium]|nr:glycosyltransferase family 2 protein [Pirellulales bacterium]
MAAHHDPCASAAKQRVSVVIAAYNEESTIATILRSLLGLPVDLAEIVVVDDGSTDRTAEIVWGFVETDPRVHLICQPRNMGKTSAIARAISEASGDIVIVQDADLEYDPAEIPDVLAPILQGQADVVYGSRFMVRKASRVLYFYHYLANRGLTFLSNVLTNRNMTDIETCYKAFRTGVIKPLTLTSKGFGMEVEITAMVCKTHARTYEVPISYYGRTYEEGKKIGMRDGIMALYYIAYYNLVKPRTAAGRRYIQAVNAFLAEHKPSHAESTAKADSLEPVSKGR